MATNVIEHRRVSPPPGAIADTTIPLTFFDLVWLLRPPISRVLFYDFQYSKAYFTETVFPNLRKSLSLVLKHFFPLAGNLILPPNISSTNPHFRYSDGDSVSLIFAECNTRDFNHLTGNHAKDADELFALVPQLPSGSNNSDDLSSTGIVAPPVLAVQLTLFPNQGISVGFTNSHTIADGNTMLHFIRAWVSCAKEIRDVDNVDDASISFQLPIYDRSLIKDTKGLNAIFRSQMGEFENDQQRKKKGEEKEKKSSEPGKPPSSSNTEKVRATFILGRTDLQGLKNLVSTKRPTLAHVSSFTVVCAYLWACMAKARVADRVEVDVGDDESELFTIAMDARARLDPPVPATYFGNCVSGCIVNARSSDLVTKEGYLTAAELIGKGLHMQLHNEEGVLKGAETWIPLLLKSTRSIGVAGSPKLDYYNIDFGWGKPKKFEFVSEPLSLSKCKDSEGDIEIGLCLPKNEMDAFSMIFAEEIGDLCKN